MFLSLILKVLDWIPGLAGKWMELQAKKADVQLEGFKTASGTDLEGYKAYLNANIETNRMKQASNSWWGAKLIILVAGIPAAMHFAAVMLDSLAFPILWYGVSGWGIPYPVLTTHAIGSWAVPKLPSPYDTYQWAIVQSFFIVMPVQTLTGAVSQWLNRK